MRLTLLLLAATACAQEIAPRHEIGFTLGRRPAISRGGEAGRLDLESGNTLQANYGYRFTGGTRAALYGEINVLSTPLQEILSANPATTRDVATLFTTPGIRVKFVPTRSVSPYVVFGAGWALFEQSTLTGGGNPNPAPRLLNRGVVTFGGGADVKLWRWFGVRGEIRDYYSGSPAYNMASLRGGQHNVVVSGGFVLRFR
jgi:Outer membrane protein beta-barrel domain